MKKSCHILILFQILLCGISLLVLGVWPNFETEKAIESIVADDELVVIPTQFVPPSSDWFDLHDENAMLYEAAVNYYFYRGNESNLLLPGLSVIDSYSYESGSVHYICWLWQFDYYGLTPEEAYKDEFSCVKNSSCGIARFTISENEADSKSVEILEPFEGEGWEKSIDMICGPYIEWANILKTHQSSYPAELFSEPITLTPINVDEMLECYLKGFRKVVAESSS